MIKLLESINGFLWGIPGVCLIICTGVYLTIRTGFAQIRLLPKAFKTLAGHVFTKNKAEGVSSYQALCTALAATVGIGNLAGVAGAICIGGPGSVFWMWICGFLGMIIKAAEATLAVRYQRTDGNGIPVGGPMYMIESGLGPKWKWLGALYSFFGVVACFGVGNATQINAALDGLETLFSGPNLRMMPWMRPAVALAVAFFIIIAMKGGAKGIAGVAEKLVPFAAIGYMLLSCGILLRNADKIPYSLLLIVKSAFSPQAVTGGAVGSLFVAMRIGASRGVFTNEAGMGTASIAHGCAKASEPMKQGLMGIVEVFIDTIVICTLTAMTILCSGVEIPYGTDVGITLTVDAFAVVYGRWANYLITFFLFLFAIATVLGWGLYGLRCAQYLFGRQVEKYFPWFQGLGVVIGAALGTGTVWTLAEIVNGLMMIPNIIALMCLSSEFILQLRENRA